MARSIAFVAAILTCSAAAVSAQDVYVPGDVPTIQQGIDSVGPNGTVFVDAGVYTESLIIDPLGALGPSRGKTAMTITSTSPGVVVQWAAGAHALPAAAATANGSSIDYCLLVKNGIDVDISGIEFDGIDDVTTGGGVRSGGIFYLQSSGTISNCTVHNFQISPTDTTDAGLGIHVEGFGAVVELYNGCRSVLT